MGIRYYAYAFDRERTEQALADPRSIISDDPLADAWGLELHAGAWVATFQQSVPERDLLYLDKAWHELQALTAPAPGGRGVRPAFRMFEGNVTMRDEGWDAWIRVLAPEEIPAIARDLGGISDREAASRFRAIARARSDPDEESEYAISYLRRARDFVSALADDGRGMVYMIG